METAPAPLTQALRPCLTWSTIPIYPLFLVSSSLFPIDNMFYLTSCLFSLCRYIAGNGLNIPLTNFYSEEYSLLKWADQVNGQGDGAPLVYSVSYGNDERQQVSTDYMFQVNTAFMAAATRGFTVLFASGDQGILQITLPT